MAGRYQFVEVPPPEVSWVALGPSGLDDDEGPKVPNRHVGVGERVNRGVAVLPGGTGAVTARTDAEGRRIWTVPVMTDDDAEQSATPIRPQVDPSTVRPEQLDEWLKRLADAGVRPDRVNCPDLVGQLDATRDKPIEAVLCSCLEPDPLLPLQYEWAALHPRAFRDGLRLLASLSGGKFVSVAVAAGRLKQLGRLLRDAVSNDRVAEPIAEVPREPTEDEQIDVEPVEVGRIRIVPVLNAYPQGDPVLLTSTLTGRRLRPGDLPSRAGVLVVDAVAAVAIGQVVRGAGVIRREPIGLRDHRRDIGVLAEVWKGSRLADVLLFLGMLPGDPEKPGDDATPKSMPKLVAGDFLRGRTIRPESLVGDGELLFHRLSSSADDLQPTPEPCIRCGWCLDICP
ncbi:MAG: hypothetical protein AAF561_07870, partial [Planctomycetota bacterium]